MNSSESIVTLNVGKKFSFDLFNSFMGKKVKNANDVKILLKRIFLKFFNSFLFSLLLLFLLTWSRGICQERRFTSEFISFLENSRFLQRFRLCRCCKIGCVVLVTIQVQLTKSREIISRN